MNKSAICDECGYSLSGAEKVCPECGNPLEDVNIEYDDYDYSKFYNCSWWLRPFHFSSEKDSEKENFDQLNDIYLLGAIIFRMILKALIVIVVYYISSLILNIILINADATSLLPFVNMIIGIGVIIAVIYCLLKGLAKYWVPCHRTFRRINKRYWMAMYKSIKNNTINNI